MDDFEIRDLHISLGGSLAIALARQLIHDRIEHFTASIQALKEIGNHSANRPVNLELEYEAMFLSLFACLERTTVSTCNDLQAVARLHLGYRDLNARGIFVQAYKYLELFETGHRIAPEVRSVIAKYQQVRHAIAHGGGINALKKKARETVCQLPGVINNTEEVEISLSEEFCGSFGEFAYRYIDELEAITQAYGSRVKGKVQSVT